jgi:hypothetical protein
VGNVDGQTLRQRLEQIDSVLRVSGLEKQFVERALPGWLKPGGRVPSVREPQKFQGRRRRALRCNILRTLLQEDYRGFSCQYWLPARQMRELINGLLQSALDRPKPLGLRQALDLEEYFLDTTALKASIHFPVDGVLLRDGVRTLMKATALIRNQGLKGRMEPPEQFSAANQSSEPGDDAPAPGNRLPQGTQAGAAADEEAG